jgi:hypothetical protein
MKFRVHAVAVSKARMDALDPESIVSAWRQVGSNIVDFSRPATDVPFVQAFDAPNLLAASVYTSFYEHFPLKINPNCVWITILQGFAMFVNADPEAVRSVFVTHEGKKLLEIERPDFFYGAKNDWASLCGDFAKFIGESTVAGVAAKLTCTFSNTTPTDACCGHIALMDAMKPFFDYRCCAGCGIPSVELLGTVGDWVTLQGKIDGLADFTFIRDPGTDWRDPRVALGGHYRSWISGLQEITAEFVAAAQGHPNLAFWGSTCNALGISGTREAPVSGWISGLFPFTHTGSRRAGSTTGGTRWRTRRRSAWRRRFRRRNRCAASRILMMNACPGAWS